jgi:putative ABC transport system permease protein
MDTLWRDIRFSVRMLCKQPLFSLTVLCLLTVGIGGTTVMFSVFNGLYLRPLPFAEPERLVNLDETAPQWNLERTGVAYPDFHVWRERNRTFEAMTVFRDTVAQVSDDSHTESLRGAQTTYDLPQVLRVKPELGRWFSREEDMPGGRRVVVLGHAVWQSRFGGRSGVIGQILRINSYPYTIVGVMPADMDFPSRVELWAPLAKTRDDNAGWGLQGAGRLKPGVSMAQAREDLLRIHRAEIGSRPANKITSPSVYALRDWYVGTLYQATTILLGAVSLVLIIACANIAGIMLARGSMRMREMGIRTALGAPRSRIVRQMLTESLVLVAIGGALGTAAGFECQRGLLALIPRNQLPGWVHFDLDWRFLLFCLAVSAASAALFGLWPAWQSSRVDVRAGLQSAGRGSSDSSGRRRSLQALIAAEVALATVLLAAAGLLFQAFRNVERIDPGFRADHVLTWQVSLPSSKYQKPEQRRAFMDELLSQYSGLPGVQNVALTSATPLGGHWGNFYEAEGAPPLRPGDPDPVILQRVVTAGYMEAMGMKLIAGRMFARSDEKPATPEVAIVNETFAKLYWSGQSAVGKRLRHRGSKSWYEVAGVMADVKDYGLDQPSRPSVYLPMVSEQLPSTAVVLRTSIDPSSLTSAARDALRRIDPDVAMARVTTMSRRLDESMWLRRAYSALVTVFAVLAVVLVLTGLYGVVSYTVSQRRREIAIRMALGAARENILRSVMTEAIVTACVGLPAGIACGWLASRLLGSLLFGVNGTDPAAYVSSIAVIALVALLASLPPALRAARVEPADALRME